MKITIHEIKKAERLFVTFHILDKDKVIKVTKIDYPLDTDAEYIEEEAKGYLAGYLHFINKKEENKEKNAALEKATKTVEKLKNLTITQ